MERLNYFHPYVSKRPHHEDQLTRAYLVLLKYSFSVLTSFYDYCSKEYNENPENKTEQKRLPYLNDLIQMDWHFETQKGNPIIDSELLLSVLITDEKIKEWAKESVSRNIRNARYDGIISIGDKMTLIIEVKPNSDNVWFQQLLPSRENLNEDTIVLRKPVILQWKEIIKQLTNLVTFTTLNCQERMLVSDFLEFVDYYFPFLNPYDTFSLCKDDEHLLFRRIDNLLKVISIDNSLVDYHRGWGYIIRVKEFFQDIYEIGMILEYNGENKSWHLELSIYFGETVSQARTLYTKQINWKILKENGWNIKPNPHIAFRSQNLVFFSSNEIQKYIDYWKSNIPNIRQYKRDEIESFLIELSNEDIIVYDDSKKKLMKDNFFDTAMSKINMCPGFGLLFKIDASDAIKMDDEKILPDFIKKKIIEAFSVTGYSENDLKKVLK